MSVRMLVWGTSRGSAVTIVGQHDRVIWCGAGSGLANRGEEFSPYGHFSRNGGGDPLDTLIIPSLRGDRIGDLVNIPVSRVRRLIRNPAALRFGRSMEPCPASKRLDSIARSASTPPVMGWPMPFGRATARLFVYCFGVTKDLGKDIEDYSVVTFLRYGTMILCLPADIGMTGWHALTTRPSFQRLKRACSVLLAPDPNPSGPFREPMDAEFPSLRLLITAAGIEHAKGPMAKREPALGWQNVRGGRFPLPEGTQAFDLDLNELRVVCTPLSCPMPNGQVDDTSSLGRGGSRVTLGNRIGHRH